MFNVSGYGIEKNGFQLEIFNRWGALIFVSNDPAIGWDGSYDGVVVQPGTYSYSLKYRLKNQSTMDFITGHVNVIR